MVQSPHEGSVSRESGRKEWVSLEKLYDEYIRLSHICNDYIKSSLGDIRLFASVGALLTWDPLARLLELDARLQQPVTPVGFIVLLLVIVMVMFYDLLKQSIFFFHMERMRELEHVLNDCCEEKRKLFHVAGGWPGWFRRTHIPVARGFFTVFYLIIVGFPSAILYLQGYTVWMALYLALAVVLLTAHARIAARVLASLESAVQS
ncbi:MAG: hypothetical protein Kow006_27500 [Gammaproteobacteria bacterium]